MKVTEVPAQIAPAGTAATETLTGKLELTTMVTAFEVAGLPVAQVALEVSTQVTISPLESVVEVYVVLLVPTFTPFNFH